MGKFTIFTIKELDKLIEKELGYIVEELVLLLRDEIKCILLTGGFGRGEGTIVYDENGVYRPGNDYDILVVVKNLKRLKKRYAKEIDRLKLRIDDTVSVKQVDLVFKDQLFFLLPGLKLVHYDNKYGSKVLYGKFNFQWPVIPAYFLPAIEGTTFFRTRGSGLIVAFLIIENQKFSEIEKKEYVFYELNKAYIGLGDAILIKNKKYNVYYKTRKEKLNKLRIEKSIIALYNKAMTKKFFLNLNEINNLKEIETEILNFIPKFILEFIKFESYRLKIPIRALNEYEKIILNKNKIINSKILASINSEFSEAKSIERLIVMYLLLSRFNKNIKLLRKAAEFLKIDANAIESPMNFIRLWRLVALRYLKNWHNDGIISKL